MSRRRSWAGSLNRARDNAIADLRQAGDSGRPGRGFS
jgi:hypothetical protein